VEETDNLFCALFFLFISFLLGGAPAPETCAQRTVEGDGFHLFERTDRGRPRTLSFFGLWDERRCLEIKINK